MIVEVIVTTVQEALDAEKGGASRLELITGVLEGGVTPSISLVKEVCNSVNIPVNVMVRPHSKSFFYDEFDKKVILNDILEIAKTKANGIVFGSLNEYGLIDTDMLEKVITVKGHLKLAYHRAIDGSKDYYGDIRKLYTYPIDIILTSAGRERIVDADNVFVDFTKEVYGKTPKLLLGSGVKPSNYKEILDRFEVEQIHIGSGVKVDSNNLKDIDIQLLKSLTNDVYKR